MEFKSAKSDIALCSALGLAWDPAMLSWAAGARPEDGVWAPWWYGTTHQSTGFTPPDGASLTYHVAQLSR